MPTTSGTGTNTFELVPYTSQAKRFSIRLDHKISDKDQIRGTFLGALYGPNPDVGASSLQGGFSGDGEHNTNTILGWTHTFSPTLLIDTYASYFHLPIYRTPQNVGTKWESIIPGLSPQLIRRRAADHDHKHHLGIRSRLERSRTGNTGQHRGDQSSGPAHHQDRLLVHLR